MIKSVLRSSGSIVFSLAVALVLVMAIEGVSAVLHPFPTDFDGTEEAMFEHVANYPVWVLALLGGAGWGITMLLGTWLATRLGTRRHPAHGIAVGLTLFAAVIFNMSMLPYPFWFVILDLIVLPLAIFYGIRLGRDSGGETLEPAGA